MLQITTEKEIVNVNISLSIGWSIDLKYQRHSQIDAVLLRNQIQSDLNNKIETIRREAYELGWKEAKSKKIRKRDWFNGNINSSHV